MYLIFFSKKHSNFHNTYTKDVNSRTFCQKKDKKKEGRKKKQNIHFISARRGLYSLNFVKDIFEGRIKISLAFLGCTLRNQKQMDSKPAGQPEHASLNQCQLIAANRPNLVLWAHPAGGGDKVSQ